MTVLISLDGLSDTDFIAFEQFCPNSHMILASLSQHSLDGIHCEAHPIWGELLTGSHWFENGCYGYAYIDSFAAAPRVFDEKCLRRKPWFTGQHDVDVLINLPILLPNKERRVWLADGSVPINQFVSPPSLRSERIFAEYIPRPYSSQGVAEGSLVRLANRCIDIERHRMKCALALFNRGSWHNFVYRVTLFDQLFHLFGNAGILHEGLGFAKNLRAFFIEFDNALTTFFSHKTSRFALLSPFSHVPCRKMINLNELFLELGLLTITSSAVTTQRARRIELSGTKQSSHNFTSYDGCVDSSSVAASPISGSIFLNHQLLSQNGISTSSELQSIRTRIQSELSNRLAQFSPKFENNPVQCSEEVMPDCQLNLDGAGFHNMFATEVLPTDFPMTVHSSKGFAFVSPSMQLKKNVSPTTLGQALACELAS